MHSIAAMTVIFILVITVVFNVFWTETSYLGSFLAAMVVTTAGDF